MLYYFINPNQEAPTVVARLVLNFLRVLWEMHNNEGQKLTVTRGLMAPESLQNVFYPSASIFGQYTGTMHKDRC
jgi:hypothetical protein